MIFSGSNATCLLWKSSRVALKKWAFACYPLTFKRFDTGHNHRCLPSYAAEILFTCGPLAAINGNFYNYFYGIQVGFSLPFIPDFLLKTTIFPSFPQVFPGSKPPPAPGNATAVGLTTAGTQTWRATRTAQRGLREVGAAARRTTKDWAEALRDPDWRQAGGDALGNGGRIMRVCQ